MIDMFLPRRVRTSANCMATPNSFRLVDIYNDRLRGLARSVTTLEAINVLDNMSWIVRLRLALRKQ